MNNIERAKKLRALKEEMEQKLGALKEAKKQKKLVEQKNSLANLFEGELERAQIILAAKDVLERLQKMAEGLAKMTAEDIMPISDNMKGVFGTEVAETFESVANEQLASALDAVRSAKEQLNTQVLRMEGKISPEEAAAPSNDMMNGGSEGGSEGGDDLGLDDLGDEGGNDDLGGNEGGDNDLGGEEGGDDASELDDLFGGDEAAAGGGEPLGRAKKESVEAEGTALTEGEEVIVEFERPQPEHKKIVAFIVKAHMQGYPYKTIMDAINQKLNLSGSDAYTENKVSEIINRYKQWWKNEGADEVHESAQKKTLK